MLVNYFILALRNLQKQKSYAFINTLGLALGLGSAFFIFLYVHHEMTYDAHHPEAQNIYRLGVIVESPDGERSGQSGVPAGWDDYLNDTYPAVTLTTSYDFPGMPVSIEYEPTNTILLTQDMIWAESSFTELLAITVVKGQRVNPLEERNSMMLNETVANSLFGSTDPINKMVTVQDAYMTGGRKINMVVTAVYKDIPSNSHIRPKYIMNILSLAEAIPNLETMLKNSMFESQDNNYFSQSLIVCEDPKTITATQWRL